MKRFLAILLLCWSWSAWTQPFLRNTFDTNQNLGFLITGTNFSVPGNISANGATYTNGVTILNDVLFVQSTAEFRMTGGEATGRFIVSDAAGVLNYTPGLTLLGGNTGTNLSLAGNLRANGGEFTNTLTLNGSPVSTNSGGISGTLTPGTVPVATGTNTLGDSGITETNDGATDYTWYFGPTNSGKYIILQPATANANGNNVQIIGGVGLNGNGGDMLVAGGNGVGTDKDGGDLTITGGNRTGSGNWGQVQLSSQDTVTLFAPTITLTGTVGISAGLTLSGQTGFPYTDDGTQLLRNGVAVGATISQNGTNGSPAVNFTNSPSVTWARSGSNWTATAIQPAGTATASGTANTLAMFTSSTNLGNSIVTQSGTNATVAGNLISQGNHTFSADNSYDIGASGATRPRTLYFGTSAVGYGPTITANAPVLDLSQTWNNSGVTFTGIRINITNTASSSSSMLLDAQVGGSSMANISQSGQIVSKIAAGNTAFKIQNGTGSSVFWNGVGQILWPSDGVMQIKNDGGTGFTRLQYGGSTAAFPAWSRTLAGFTLMGADGVASSTNNLIVPGSLSVSNITGTATLLAGLTSSNTLAGVGIGTGLAMSGTNLTATATGSGVTTQVTPLAYSGTNITGFDCTTNNMTYTLVLTNDCLFGSSTFVGLPNTTTNVFFTLALQQDSTGTRVPKFTNSIVKWSEGVQPVVSTQANAVSYLYFHSHLFTNGMLVGTVNLNVH